MTRTEITSSDLDDETILTLSGNTDGFISCIDISYTITVHYYLTGTIDSIAEDETYEYVSGYEYSVSPTSIVNTKKYTLTSTTGTTSGTLYKDITIIYYYEETTVSVSITKVNSNKLKTLSGVTFSLYRLICEDESHIHDTDDDLIDINFYDITCWELIGTYTTGEDGAFTLSDLPITGIYRLVETKTVEDYLLPNGQWKIEFDYDDNLTGETITVDDIIMQITAIGNPPALSLLDGVLYLYNSSSYDIPITGGTKYFYLVGILIILLGVFVQIIGKKSKCTIEKSNSFRQPINNIFVNIKKR